MNKKYQKPSGKVTMWIPISNKMLLRRMGKTGEECAELLAVTNRIIIQGIDEIDPSSGETNRQRLIDEIADVYAQLDETVKKLLLDKRYIEKRRERKRGYMEEWEEMFNNES